MAIDALTSLGKQRLVTAFALRLTATSLTGVWRGADLPTRATPAAAPAAEAA